MDFKDLDTSLKVTRENVNLYSCWLFANREKLQSLKDNERSSFITKNISSSSGNAGAIISFIKKTGLANADLTASELAQMFATGRLTYAEICFIHLSKESLFNGTVPTVSLLNVISKYIIQKNTLSFLLKDIRSLDEDLNPLSGDTISNQRTDYIMTVLEGTGLFSHVGKIDDGHVEIKQDALPIMQFIADNPLSNCLLTLNSKERFNYFAGARGGVFNILSSSIPAVWTSYFPHITSSGIANPARLEHEELQQIFYGAPGTGKSYKINQCTQNESAIRTTFHPDSDYSTFVGAYKPTTKHVKVRDMAGHVVIDNGEEVMEDRIIYEYVEQAFLQAYVKAWKQFSVGCDKGDIEKQYLIIEEINRGNCAQIFGDIFQLLDRNEEGFSSYPVTADHDIQNQIAKEFESITIPCASYINGMYSGKNIVSKILSGELLVLPNNLFIWATMNTSDQSLFPIDSAFKRRWEWQYIPIRKGKDENGIELEWYIDVDNYLYDWWSFLKNINDEIGDTTSSEDKKLGFFFCKAEDGAISAKKFVGKVVFYLWNDVFKDFGFDNKIFKDADGTTISFDKFFTEDGSGNTVVNTTTLKTFLNNLDVEEFIIDNDTPSNSGYKLDGNGPFSLRDIAKKVVENFIAANPSMSAQEVRDTFVNACAGIGVAHVVETESEYGARSGQKSAERTVSEVTLATGEHVYVSTQWRANNEKSNFSRFIDIVADKGWGIISK